MGDLNDAMLLIKGDLSYRGNGWQCGKNEGRKHALLQTGISATGQQTTAGPWNYRSDDTSTEA